MTEGIDYMLSPVCDASLATSKPLDCIIIAIAMHTTHVAGQSEQDAL